MFRNSQLLRRSGQIAGNKAPADSRPIAILADPYDAEAGIIAPILQRHGFRVLEARDGSMALELARSNSASLVVASADMPNISGPQLCQKVREYNGVNTPFLLISPKDALPDKYAGHETFASDYAVRPLNLEDFESRLSAVLRGHNDGSSHVRVVQAPAEPVVATSIAAVPEAPSLKTINQRTAPVAPPPLSDSVRADVKDSGLAVPLIETEQIESLLSDEYLSRHEVSKDAAALYKEAFVFLNGAIRAAQNNDPLDLETAAMLSRRIASVIRADKSLLMLATDRTTIFSFRQHSVNVAIIGTRIAQTLHLSDERQMRVCLAGMLHDLGSVKLPKRLISKLSGFSASERKEIQKRPEYSAELVTGYAGYDWLPGIVVQVYERENGTGYPRGIRGRDICEEARILAIADVFEACIHRRPQRAAMTGYRALEVLTSEVDSFGERTTKAMIRSFSVYPFNEFVVLNTGEIGQVIDINTENPLRPIVSIIYTVEKEALTPPRIVDLARNSQLWITSAISPDDLPGDRA